MSIHKLAFKQIWVYLGLEPTGVNVFRGFLAENDIEKNVGRKGVTCE